MLLLGLLLCCFSLVSCTSSVGSSNRNTLSEVRRETAHERMISNQLMSIVNRHRKSIGHQAIAPTKLLKGLAMEHSLYLSYNHDGVSSLEGIAHTGTAQRAGMLRANSSALMGENVVWSRANRSNIPQVLFDTLMSSKPHRKAIESMSWTNSAVSVVHKNNAYYATQLFSKPNIHVSDIPQFSFLRVD